MKQSTVLVVDDSRSMRQLITSIINATPDLRVIGEAADPIEARSAIKALSPDVITLDVEMPKMNGLDFLQRLMDLRPTPVVMVSNLTKNGTESTIKALEIGAIDCIVKPQPGDRSFFTELVEKVRIAASAHVESKGQEVARAAVRPAAPSPARAIRPTRHLIAIGSSTGGVEALTRILADFPADCPPTVITQHMPPLFTKSLADRLDRTCAPKIQEAMDGTVLEPGCVYIAPGNPTHHLEVMQGSELRCRLRQGPRVNGHCPSVDVLFNSVAKAKGADATGVILTGMGRDGASGLLAMREAGARTLGQDAASSVVYGMPRVAFEIGAVERQLSLNRIGSELFSPTYA